MQPRDDFPECSGPVVQAQSFPAPHGTWAQAQGTLELHSIPTARARCALAVHSIPAWAQGIPALHSICARAHPRLLVWLCLAPGPRLLPLFCHVLRSRHVRKLCNVATVCPHSGTPLHGGGGKQLVRKRCQRRGHIQCSVATRGSHFVWLSLWAWKGALLSPPASSPHHLFISLRIY